MEVPRFDLLFRPPQYQPQPNETDNFINNIQALKDPTGTLNRLQNEQIIKSMADIKTEGMEGLYQQRALDEIKAYQTRAKERYKSNKGFNRLSLDADQMLEQNQDYRNLLMNINAGRQLTEDYRKTMMAAAAAVANGSLLPGDYDNFVAELETKNAKASNIGDMKMPQVIYNKYLQHSTKTLDTNRNQDTYKMAATWAGWINKPQSGVEMSKYDDQKTKSEISRQMNSPEWSTNILPMLITSGVVVPGMTDQQKLDAASSWVKSQFNPYENRSSAPTVNINTGGGGINPNVAQVPYDKTSNGWDFSIIGDVNDRPKFSEPFQSKDGVIKPTNGYVKKMSVGKNGKWIAEIGGEGVDPDGNKVSLDQYGYKKEVDNNYITSIMRGNKYVLLGPSGNPWIPDRLGAKTSNPVQKNTWVPVNNHN